MMVTTKPFARQVQIFVQRWDTREDWKKAAKNGLFALCGFFLSAASLGNYCQCFPLALLLCAPPGWPVLLTAAGAAVGYPVFWGMAGLTGLGWIVMGLLAELIVERLPFEKSTPMLMPAIGGTIVAGTDLVLLLRGLAAVPMPMYVLRVGLAVGSTWLIDFGSRKKDVFALALLGGIGVLSLSQVAITPWFCLGYAAAAAVSAWGAFPAAAMAGLALDLSQVTKVPMTAVLCLAFLLRLIPKQGKWFGYAAPVLTFVPVMLLAGRYDPTPILPLAVGGGLAAVIPHPTPAGRRRGETAGAQVRLEMAAGVFSQAEKVLLELSPTVQDEAAVFGKVLRDCCDGCPCRTGCKSREEMAAMDPKILGRAWISRDDLKNGGCKKAGRLINELRRGQEQLRRGRREQARMKESRMALMRQYRFLADYLRELSDSLANRTNAAKPCYRPEVGASTAGKEAVNGDRAIWFAGTGNRYYVLLCDGMGTGEAAARESREACQYLQQLLQAGFPASSALGGYNDLCALRGTVAYSTADLAELELDTGKVTVYKLGGAPSYLVEAGRTRKIGTAAPPPGLSVGERPVAEERLSLGHGEMLLLLSDGAEGEDVLRRAETGRSASPGETAAHILSGRDRRQNDDATAVVIRLQPV